MLTAPGVEVAVEVVVVVVKVKLVARGIAFFLSATYNVHQTQCSYYIILATNFKKTT